MVPGAHLVLSWLSAASLLRERRERIIVTYVGIAPDLDGLGIIIDKLTGTTQFYLSYHHYWGHCAVAALIVSIVAVLLAKTQKIRVAILSVLVFHLHLLCDILGSKGADGYQWPVYYLYPFDAEFGLTWSGQWELGSWQNSLIILLALALCLGYAIKKRISFLEIFGRRFEGKVFEMCQKYSQKDKNNNAE